MFFTILLLAKDLIVKNNDVASYFLNAIETGYNDSKLNINTFFINKELANLNVYDSNDILNLFTKNVENPSID